MPIKYKMDEEARDKLDRRVRIGIEACELADAGEERETQARDIVADILSALFGPAGYCVFHPLNEQPAKIVLDEERGTLARTFLDMALDSWEGDAEDYTAEAVTVDNPLLGEASAPKVYRLVLEISEDELADLRDENTDDVCLIRDHGTVVPGEAEYTAALEEELAREQSDPN